jgi:folate-binding protein YgfZ
LFAGAGVRYDSRFDVLGGGPFVNRATPLEATMVENGATLGDDAGWSVPLAFAGVESEIAALHTGIAVADVSHFGHFTLAGKNSVKFLQGLVTNDVTALAPGTGCLAAFLNVHGRIEAVAYVFAAGENDLVIQTPPEATDWVATSLGRFRLAGGFDLEALDGVATIAVAGRGAREALERAIGVAIDEPLALGYREVQFEGEKLRLLGVPRTAASATDVVGPAVAVAALWRRLVAEGATPVGAGALEVARMEAGIARFGRDFDADTVLQEADVPGIVSMHKGCYLGQEIVARLHFLGQPSKLLRRLDVGDGPIPARGAEVVTADDDEKVAGRVTSAVMSPTAGPIVFAVVKRKYYAEGTAVAVRVGEQLVPATVQNRATTADLQETR